MRDEPRNGEKSPSRSSLPHHPRKLMSAPPAPPPPPPPPASSAAHEPVNPQQGPPSPANLSPSDWAENEAEWWREALATRALEDQSMSEKYEQKTAPLKGRRAELLDERARLSEQLKLIKQQCEEVETDLGRIDLQFLEAKTIVANRRKDQDENAKHFFEVNMEIARSRLASQGLDKGTAATIKPRPQSIKPASEAVHTYTHPHTPASDDGAIDERKSTNTSMAARQLSVLPSSESSPLSQPSDEAMEGAVAEVRDDEGNFVDYIRPIKLNNKYIRNILQVPIKRNIIVRSGRKFTKETMQSIYEPSDNKGAKWLSCMIQATGEEQELPCNSCMNRAGTWAGCVIVGGNDFPRCANCEWNRQGCAGSSYHQDRLDDPDVQSGAHPMASPSPLATDDSERASREGNSAGGFTAVNGAGGSRTAVPSSAPLKRTTLPSKKGGRKSLPSMPSAGKENMEPRDGSVPAEDEAAASDVDPGPDITAERLHLRDDGVVYTEPAIMRGVPIERIHPGHPYWEQDWPDPLPILQAKYEDWLAKLDACLASGKNRFLAGRQVNRGKTIVDFLQNGAIHPYQLLGKKFITKALVSYDTIFRLAQVLEELPKLNIDVNPVDWVRERMHELYLEEGESFSLAKTVHELYHDAKLRALRSRAGVGNIGRPSGVRKGATGKAAGPRRKDLDDTPHKKRRRASTVVASKKANRTSQAEATTTVSPRSIKKQRLDDTNNSKNRINDVIAQPATGTDNDSSQAEQAILTDSSRSVKQEKGSEGYHDGYTTSDSSSGGKMTRLDWRVLQVRTPENTTSTEHTQVLHWVAEDNSDVLGFEHQILLNVDPPKWVVYQDPFDFHVRLRELEKIEFCRDEDCGKVVIHTASTAAADGDGNSDDDEGRRVKTRRKILVHFKRGRTQDRFLQFVKQKLQGLRSVSVEETSRDFIEMEWTKVDSKVLPVDH
ncbi:hypothetical protein BD289DRAFT_454939 [Coniella lustricola]|uniref:Uncharacterized protein n=1 Tax=Coniella lustricola TaxID=2025994 RepID=A0A2T3A1L1_9PEZI|nr:hypothetical protein BD289DRAFT_454939 [Coniella lustricola]